MIDGEEKYDFVNFFNAMVVEHSKCSNIKKEEKEGDDHNHFFVSFKVVFKGNETVINYTQDAVQQSCCQINLQEPFPWLHSL